MTRQELYDRVWKTPMRTLAPSFGVSDVALAKLCRKHLVPVPPRGYWAQLAAGQKPRRPRLPSPELDGQIDLLGGTETLRRHDAMQRSAAAKVRVEAPAAVALPSGLARCHPAVKQTAAFFAAIRKQVDEQARRDARARRPSEEPQLRIVARTVSGRHQCQADGAILVLAALTNIEWILRFLQALTEALQACGAQLLPCVTADNLGSRIMVDGHCLSFSLAEGFDKVVAPSRGMPWIEYEYRALDVYKLKLRRERRADKVWDVSRANLEEDVAGYAAKIVAAVREDHAAQILREKEEAELRARAEARAIVSKAWFAEQERIGRQRKARKAQVERALDVGKAQLQYEATLRVLADLEARFAIGEEGAGLRAWLGVARAGLTPPVDALLANLQSELAAKGGPDWWPEG